MIKKYRKGVRDLITVWSVAIVVFMVIEGVTAGLASIWFAFGAGAALLSALCHAQIWLQVVWFVVVSIATLILTRPLARKYLNARIQPTNADRCIGQKAVVTEAIDNLLEKGEVKVGGKYWTARSADGQPIAPDTVVVVTGMEGVKLFVVPADGTDAK